MCCICLSLPYLAVLQRMGWSREDAARSVETPFDASDRSLEWQKPRSSAALGCSCLSLFLAVYQFFVL